MRAEIAAFREQSRIDREQQSTDRETNRLTQQRMQDLEDENTALARALDRRHQHNEALTQALARASQLADLNAAPITGNTNTAPAPPTEGSQRLIQVPVDLFPESLRHLPPPPLPQPVHGITPVPDANTALLVQMSNSLHALQARVQATENRDTWRAMNSYEDRPGPFTQQVRGAIRANTSKPLKIDYTGVGDPYQHLQAFRSQTNAKGYTDEVCCNIFQETLSGEALSWFYELPVGSVGNFKELVDKFVTRFILRIDGIHTPKGLLKIQQGEDETLKSFVNRWQAATAKSRDLNKELAELAFRRGLRRGEFLYGINHNPPASYDELMATVIRHAQAEFETYGDTPRPELRFSTPTSTIRDEPRKREWVHNHDRSPHTSNKRGKESSSRSNSYGNTHPNREPRAQQGPRTPPPPRYEVFTILNASYETVWNENMDEIPGPPPRKFPKSKLTQQDTGKFCTYHEDAGHNTNLCVALKIPSSPSSRGASFNDTYLLRR
ncbi:uncharacterized protein LOC112184203 [Rosa chinensis]|uniref:uncharacterized protein LOC112184203 n=1 Tax=Rosa chinensis TaxID=74649 RepID=UPI000D08B920|nr:uncharacterized protein LOC112184203 [Rosa chinensis]